MSYVIAIDMGATNIRVGILNDQLEIMEVVRERTTHEGNDALISQIIRLIHAVHSEKYPVRSITIGVPGRVRKNGFIDELPNIHVQELDLVHPLEATFHVPTYVINDAVAAGIAEAVAGSGKDADAVFFVTISSGVGGSFFVHQTFTPSSHEIGHTLFSYQNHYYEFEKIASGYGLLTLAACNGLHLQEGYEVFLGYQNHDPLSTKVYQDWLQLMQRFFSFIQNTFAPDVIVLTGGVMKSASIFFEDMKKMNPQSRLVMAFFDQDAGLIGAGCYGLQKAENTK